MMPGAVVAILALAGLAYVAAALASPAEEAPAPADGRRADLERRARAALVAIVDLEDERDAGKLTHGDFEALVGTHEQEALAALDALDELEGVGPDDPVEREIAEVKARLRAGGERAGPDRERDAGRARPDRERDASRPSPEPGPR